MMAAGLGGWASVEAFEGTPASALDSIEGVEGFAAVLTDGRDTLAVVDRDGRLAAAAARPGEPDALSQLDVTVAHRSLIERALGRPDDVETVGYVHTIAEALARLVAVKAGRQATFPDAGVAVLDRVNLLGVPANGAHLSGAVRAAGPA